MNLIEDNISRSRGEVANAVVCKTAIHGCNSHRDLEYGYSYNDGEDAVCCNCCM